MQFPVLLELSPPCGSCKVVATGWCAAVEKPKEEEEEGEGFRGGIDVIRPLCSLTFLG